jgi:hypothetical protein
MLGRQQRLILLVEKDQQVKKWVIYISSMGGGEK